DFELMSMKPDGSDSKELPRLFAGDVQGYQTYSARLSPDGKRVVFGKAVQKVADNGSPAIYPPDTLFLRDPQKSAESQQLAHFTDSELHHWVWSPDGAKIAVISWDKENRTRNWIVDVKSRDVTEVKLPKYKFRDKEHAMGIRDWSPDGKTFAATGDGLHLVKADGTHIKRLFDAGQAHLGHCRFSPDGRKILFIASEKDAGNLSLRTID